MPQTDETRQNITRLRNAFDELKQIEHLQDTIEELLCNEKDNIISDKIRYLFSLLTKETNQGLSELEQALEILSAKE